MGLPVLGYFIAFLAYMIVPNVNISDLPTPVRKFEQNKLLAV